MVSNSWSWKDVLVDMVFEPIVHDILVLKTCAELSCVDCYFLGDLWVGLALGTGLDSLQILEHDQHSYNPRLQSELPQMRSHIPGEYTQVLDELNFTGLIILRE